MKISALGITAAVIAIVLSGCAAEETEEATLTLAETKGSAQLMRNIISGQISPEITAAVTDVTDASETCDSDSEGFMRLWRSTARTELTPDAASKVMTIQQTIAGSFVSKGWTSESVKLSESSTIVTLTNPDSLAVIDITATTDDDGVGTGATVFVDIAGPCVKTDGPGSAELKQLGE